MALKVHDLQKPVSVPSSSPAGVMVVQVSKGMDKHTADGQMTGKYGQLGKGAGHSQRCAMP